MQTTAPSNRRLAAARRAIARDLEANALTPELVQHRDPAERIAHVETENARHAARWNAGDRATAAEAAALLRAMPKAKRRAALRFCRSTYPDAPAYVIEYVRNVAASRRSPFRDLRMTGLFALARDGKIPFRRVREILEAFDDHRRPRDPVTTEIRARIYARHIQPTLF